MAENILNEIKSRLGESIDVIEDSTFPFIRTGPVHLLDVMGHLKERAGFNYLANLTAVDYKEEFEIVYHLYTIPGNRKLGVKTRVSREKPVLPSVFSIWVAADWQEREIFDLFGIGFIGHPNLARILLPDEFEGYPLRKDFRQEG
ncbi:MAG: NADH-quinone oxidoreductase subunit C [Syntrophomonas sp.]